MNTLITIYVYGNDAKQKMLQQKHYINNITHVETNNHT